MLTEQEQNKYLAGFESLTEKEKWVYVEGKSNGIFYNEYTEFGRLPIKNGGSCSNIISLVRSNKNRFGIIDNDYRLSFDIERVYPINFYSIENISLMYCPVLTELIESINAIFLIFDFEKIKKSKLTSDILRDSYHRPIDFKITISEDELEKNRLEYLNIKIKSIEDFYRFKNLKNEVVMFVRFLKETKGKESVEIFNFCHLKDLLPSKELSFLFDEHIYKSLLSEMLIHCKSS